MTVRGAAIAAGLGAKVWTNIAALPELPADVFESEITEAGERMLTLDNILTLI